MDYIYPLKRLQRRQFMNVATSLVLELTEQARDGEGVKLFVDFPKLSMIGWHNKNLKKLREALGA